VLAQRLQLPLLQAHNLFAALALQATTPEQFDRWVDPAQMLAPRAP
jgi:hypothetical protein